MMRNRIVVDGPVIPRAELFGASDRAGFARILAGPFLGTEIPATKRKTSDNGFTGNTSNP